jgi:hypothetical protein
MPLLSRKNLWYKLVTEVYESVEEGLKYPESELDTPALKVIITGSRLVKGGFFSSSYVTYSVFTKQLDLTVERRYSEFYWLHHILARDYFGVYVRMFY